MGAVGIHVGGVGMHPRCYHCLAFYTFLPLLNGLTSHLEGEEENYVGVVHLVSDLKVFIALLVPKIQQLAACLIQLWLF
jgi:hypothetical protein